MWLEGSNLGFLMQNTCSRDEPSPRKVWVILKSLSQCSGTHSKLIECILVSYFLFEAIVFYTMLIYRITLTVWGTWKPRVKH